MGNATASLLTAARALTAGAVIAYPTEAVYGLGCLPTRPDTLQRLIALKHRQAGKGLILIGASPAQLAPYTHGMSADDWRILAAAHRQPITWLVPAAAGIPELLTGGRETIALRITQHPLARQLCLTSGSAIVSTSANLSGQPPPRDFARIAPQLRRNLDLVLVGQCGSSRRPSQIRDLRSGQLLRL